MTKKKETSDRVSKIAARVLRKLAELPGRFFIELQDDVRVRDIRALAASCLSQDETKGKRKPAKRRARK